MLSVLTPISLIFLVSCLHCISSFFSTILYLISFYLLFFCFRSFFRSIPQIVHLFHVRLFSENLRQSDIILGQKILRLKT
jgi:hypothetical protein